jgi:hypothetical protein
MSTFYQMVGQDTVWRSVMNVLESALYIQFFEDLPAAETRESPNRFEFELCALQLSPKPYPYSRIVVQTKQDQQNGDTEIGFGPFIPRRTWSGEPDPSWRAPCLIGLTNPRKGREQDFDDWYWNHHFPDGLRLPGCIAGRRYKLSDRGSGAYKHLAVYQYNTKDMSIVIDALNTRTGTPEMPMSDAISNVFQAWFVTRV